MNKSVLNDLPGEFYTIVTNGKFPIMLITHRTVQAAQNQKQTKQ